jgi:hypothetical protein
MRGQTRPLTSLASIRGDRRPERRESNSRPDPGWTRGHACRQYRTAEESDAWRFGALVLTCDFVAHALVDSHLHVGDETTFLLSKEDLELVMDGMAERLWFG